MSDIFDDISNTVSNMFDSSFFIIIVGLVSIILIGSFIYGYFFIKENPEEIDTIENIEVLRDPEIKKVDNTLIVLPTEFVYDNTEEQKIYKNKRFKKNIDHSFNIAMEENKFLLADNINKYKLKLKEYEELDKYHDEKKINKVKQELYDLNQSIVNSH
jgi:hypothetical protein